MSSTLSETEKTEAVDRRVSTRVPFSAALGVSTLVDNQIPPTSEFVPVRGFNLSHTGISFTTDKWPRSDRLAVMLGDPDQPTFVITRIVGCVRKKSGKGALPFKVHCEFEKWVQGDPCRNSAS